MLHGLAKRGGGRTVAANRERVKLPHQACGRRGADRVKKAQRCRSPAPTGGQAAGGARDWNAARRGAMAMAATRSSCAIACEASGSGKGGAAAAKELPSSETAAQIAQ